MIKNLFYLLTAVVVMFFASCEKYDHAISDIEDRLDKIEGVTLTTIEQQIAAINGSIDDLKEVDAQLDGYIKALQTTAADLQSQLDATNEKIDNVKKEMGDEIDAVEQNLLNQLNGLKTYIEGQLATINNTIATLQAKDAELDQKIADLKTYVDNTLANYATKDWATATFSTLEQYEETQTAISQINALIKSTQESLAALEEQLSKKIADATDALKKAITASETSMKEWVNGVLADGYYQKAEIDGKITALQTLVAEGDAALQKEIDDLKAALGKAESDLSEAYKKAIEEAINEYHGKISAEIAAAVATAQDNLQAQIDAITGEIEKIKAHLDIIEADIASINQQIIAINGSINDLKKVDAELDGYIKSLQTTAADLQTQLDATNEALAALESDLEGPMTALEQKVLNELTALKTALEGQLSTINNNIATLTSQLNAIEGKITLLESAVANCATQADLAEVQQDLAAVKSEMAAIKTNIIDLQTRMTTVEKDVDLLQTAVDDLVDRIAELEKNFANRIQSLIFIPQYSDGKVAMNYKTRTTQAFFRISPSEIARLISDKNVKAFARYTKDPATRASYQPEFPLSVISVLGDETGMLEVNIAESSEYPLSTDFWQGKVEPIIYIQIIDDYGNDVVSETIPMIPHNYEDNSSDVVIAKFQHYFCDPNGNMAIHPLDEFSHIWAVGITSGERACEIFSDITGLLVTANESYTYSYQSEDGRVELRITGNLTADENAVYATLYVTIPGYEDVDQIKIVTPEYLKQDNADAVITIII